MSSIEKLKRRKIVQWALAYLAGAWVVLQLLDVVAEPWGMGAGLLLAAQIILAFGFLATLVLGWYHGEQGRQRVSGPELLMLAALLVIAGGVIALVRANGETPAGETGEASMAAGADSISERSIAVLPLDDNSPDPDNAYFARAITEEITNALSKVPELHVIARNSAAKFSESGMTVGEFARQELEVAHVLEGSVQLVGNRARITVQLIDTATEGHVWSDTYEVELTDILDVQIEIARQVADRLAASFTEREMERFEAGGTADPVAYERYLRARSEVRDEEAIELYRQALERDPEFGMAWYFLGNIYARRYEQNPQWADSARMAFQRAAEHSDAPAARLWPQAILTGFFDGDLDQAGALIEEALAADSTFYPAIADGRKIYEATGDLPKAVRLARRAAAFDPLSGYNWRYLGNLYRTVGLDSLAERAFRRAIDLEPASDEPWEELLELRLYQGRYEQASVVADSLETRDPRGAVVWRAIIDAWSGQESRARETLEEVYASRESGTLWQLADLLAHLRLLAGDTTGAHALLDEAEDAVGRRHVLDRVDVRNLHWHGMRIAAVRGNVDEAVSSFQKYVDVGGRDVRGIAPNPVLSRVLDGPAFQSQLEKLERRVERQRRQIERDLAKER